MQKIDPAEIFILQVYSSAQYLGELRDIWGTLVKHVNDALDSYVAALPQDYRSRPLPYQPDIVWGERVLPNFRSTFQGLCDGYIKVFRGDYSGLRSAYGPTNDFKGQSEFWVEWMTDAQLEEYGRLLNCAVARARNICATEGAYWEVDEITIPSIVANTVSVPAQRPTYVIDIGTAIRSGERCLAPGVYMADVANASPQFLYDRHGGTPEAYIASDVVEILHPVSGEILSKRFIYSRKPCVWRRVVEADPIDNSLPEPVPDLSLRRAFGGSPCPVSGYYFTPAKQDSRRWFDQGEITPDFQSDYGTVIWQWEANQ